NTNTNQLLLRARQDSSSTILDRSDIEFNEDWHWIRLRVEGDKLFASLWNDESEEPDNWEIEYELNENDEITNDAGYFLLGATNFDYDDDNTIYFDEMAVKDLSAGEESAKAEEEAAADEDTGEKSTIHLSVNDRDGNIVSYTSTIVSIGGNG